MQLGGLACAGACARPSAGPQPRAARACSVKVYASPAAAAHVPGTSAPGPTAASRHPGAHASAAYGAGKRSVTVGAALLVTDADASAASGRGGAPHAPAAPQPGGASHQGGAL